MLVKQNELITFMFQTYDPSTGGNKSADETPVGTIHDKTGAAIAQVPLMNEIGTDGLYRVTFQPDDVNFTIGDEYIVIASATVTGSAAENPPTVTARAVVGQFQVAGVNHGKDLVNAIDGYTPQQILAVIVSALLGTISTAGENTEVYLNLLNNLDRITAAVDSEGNRSNVTFDISDLS